MFTPVTLYYAHIIFNFHLRMYMRVCEKNPVTGVNSVTTFRINRLGVTCCVTFVNISNKKTAALVEQR